MIHSTHVICVNHYKLALEGKHPMECCTCTPAEGCGDDNSSKWVDAQVKRFKEEQSIIKAQRQPDIGEDGYDPDSA